jgi:hypothetical protein
MMTGYKWVPKRNYTCGLAPGTYHFQGRIYNAYGITSDSKKIEFLVVPQWYQTVYFKLAMVLMGILVISFFMVIV